jgi:hypothetical protein
VIENAEGKLVCYHCADGEVCPIQAKRMRAAKKNTPPDETPPTNESNSGKTGNEPQDEGKTMLNTESDTPKICTKPGCTTPLGPKNRSGKCGPHFHWTAPEARSSSAAEATNGHAHAPGNGVTAKTNGHSAPAPKNGNGHSAVDALPDFSSARVDEFIASLTPPTKTKIVTMWLRGEL